MSYTKTNWQNGVTPINETNLNKIENELETLDGDVSSLDTNKVNTSAIKNTNSISTSEVYSASYINSLVASQMITVKLSSNYSLTANSSYEKLPLVSSTSIGSAFSISSNQVSIGAGVSHVEISGTATISGTSSNGNRYLKINKVHSGTTTAITVLYLNIPSNTTGNLACAPFIVGVSQGDLIKVEGYGFKNDAFVGNGSENRTYFTIRKID